MKIENLENLQEITIDTLSSVEGGMLAIRKPIDKAELRIDPDYKRIPIYPCYPPPRPLPCYTRPVPFPDKEHKVIPLRICPVIL
ncbi:hypothetical protein BJP34_34390 [Moorena producens PAL-8-15-08-1]|uniref:Uncharacterized protein n=1 Tax=Moorena producens PAL-8-15-08-1 TaxID=1458985 RepID=A0A1D8U1T7_9CYAN|nr:hypothetical protein [Moorena producens]AOX03848.1 hypothetical protein BJP34_34390 [Moorena producens PAL-8-15-08-1]